MQTKGGSKEKAYESEMIKIIPTEPRLFAEKNVYFLIKVWINIQKIIQKKFQTDFLVEGSSAINVTESYTFALEKNEKSENILKVLKRLFRFLSHWIRKVLFYKFKLERQGLTEKRKKN